MLSLGYCDPGDVTGCLFNQLVYCMATFTSKNKKKQVKIFTVIYYKMPIPCNTMVDSIENAHFKGSCGILWYPAVIRLTLIKVLSVNTLLFITIMSQFDHLTKNVQITCKVSLQYLITKHILCFKQFS